MKKLYLLKQIEQKHWVKVHRISGCSIGSISALLYLTDNLDLCESFYKESRNHFINNHNLEYGKFWLYGFKKKYLKKKSYIKFNNRLFITYWDTLLCKQIVKSTFLEVLS